MSYEIFYKKQFIKIDDKNCVPMVEAGSNNCYEATGRNARRARSWSLFNHYFKGALFGTWEQMEAALEAERKDLIEREKSYEGQADYEDKSWGWFTAVSLAGRGTGGTSYQMWKGWLKTGFKQALTVEELREHNVDVIIHAYVWEEKELNEKYGKELRKDVVVQTTDELINTYLEWQNYYKGTNASVYVHMNDWQVDRLHKKLHGKKKLPKAVKQLDKFYVLQNCVEGSQYKGLYYKKKTSRATSYAWEAKYGKTFATKGKAETFRKRMREPERFEVAEINEPIQILVPKVGSLAYND
jgi:hypothetical protein